MSSKIQEKEKLDPRIRRTRALLGQAFIDCVSAKGFQAVSVHDITEKAGVNRSTFYLHFADKYALLDYAIGEYFEQEMAKRLADANGLSLDNLRRLIATVGEGVLNANAHCTPAEPQFESLVEAQVKQHVQRLLQGWLAPGDDTRPGGTRLAPTMDPAIVATAASWAIYGLVLQWSRSKTRVPAEAFADRILPLILPILDPGRSILEVQSK